MKIDKNWFRRRFWDFRQGHGTYLGYALSFINFVTITYTLLRNQIPLLQNIFPHFYIYAIIFFMVYPILAISVGHIEFRKKQYPTDVEIASVQNPFLYKLYPGKEKSITYPATIVRLRLDMKLWEKLGVLTPEEKCKLTTLIEKMEKLMQGETLPQK